MEGKGRGESFFALRNPEGRGFPPFGSRDALISSFFPSLDSLPPRPPPLPPDKSLSLNHPPPSFSPNDEK